MSDPFLKEGTNHAFAPFNLVGGDEDVDYHYYINPDQFNDSPEGYAAAFDKCVDAYLDSRGEAVDAARRLAGSVDHHVVIQEWILRDGYPFDVTAEIKVF